MGARCRCTNHCDHISKYVRYFAIIAGLFRLLAFLPLNENTVLPFSDEPACQSCFWNAFCKTECCFTTCSFNSHCGLSLCWNSCVVVLALNWIELNSFSLNKNCNILQKAEDGIWIPSMGRLVAEELDLSQATFYRYCKLLSIAFPFLPKMLASNSSLRLFMFFFFRLIQFRGLNFFFPWHSLVSL